MNELSTKDRILNSAEVLFSNRGIDATSLRDITSHAGVNLAAVNYHFRSKDELVWAVYERRVAPMSAERLARLDKLERQSVSPGIEELLDAFYRPMIAATHLPDGSIAPFVPLMGRMYLEHPEIKERIFNELIRPVADRYIAAFSAALPHLSPLEVTLRVQFCVGALLHMLIGSRLVELFVDKSANRSVDTVVGRLVTFAAAGLRAPAYSEESVNA